MSEYQDLTNRLRGIYRVPITDGVGPAGGEEPENAHEFVRTFETSPINREAANAIEAQAKEIADLKSSVVAFCAPWAVQYAKDFGLDGLHPGHYDLLEKCGARLVDFKRAEIKDDATSP